MLSSKRLSTKGRIAGAIFAALEVSGNPVLDARVGSDRNDEVIPAGKADQREERRLRRAGTDRQVDALTGVLVDNLHACRIGGFVPDHERDSVRLWRVL